MGHTDLSALPADWHCETADPLIWHEPCPRSKRAAEYADGECMAWNRVPLGDGGFRVTETWRFTCPDCGAYVELHDVDDQPAQVVAE